MSDIEQPNCGINLPTDAKQKLELVIKLAEKANPKVVRGRIVIDWLAVIDYLVQPTHPVDGELRTKTKERIAKYGALVARQGTGYAEHQNADMAVLDDLMQLFSAHLQAAVREARPDIQMLNDNIVYAERYAINRQSYASASVADDITKLLSWDILYAKTTAVLIRNIEAALNEGLPYVDQQRRWSKVLQLLKKEASK